MPVDLDRPAFEQLVDRALDGIPDELAALVDNLVVLVEEEPPEGSRPTCWGCTTGWP
ncbi:hypothetical protein [Nocardioides zeae]